MPDDIRDVPASGSDESKPRKPNPPAPARPLKEVGPESEVRGGPDAPKDD